MSAEVFVDSNVLIYAHDLDAGRKRIIAADILRELWAAHRGTLSTQVLQEFYVNATRKIPHPLTLAAAREIVANYCAWPVEAVGPKAVLRASEIEERYRLSFWDALIVAAAARCGAAKILSEDMNAGQRIEGILIENPF
jgi:predicted nucleic acid-binding protein